MGKMKLKIFNLKFTLVLRSAYFLTVCKIR